MGILWETSFWVFFFVTIVLAGGAAWMSGRAIARSWEPYWQAAAWMLPLGAAARFIHFSLFGGSLLSVQYYVVDTAILMIIAWLGHRVTLAGLMTRQYRFGFEQVSPLTWRARGGAAGGGPTE
ncbi:DUF6867 family protein [Salinarimonas sp. NSM]|uniref:DUF6867 family protein n=1 Tax=Salinarimonas sp. NSM TaxID=3458003 RepID=UPI00403625B9